MPIPTPRILPVLEDARRSEERWGVHHCLILAVLDKETLCGQTPALDIEGPGGTGDFTPRLARRYAKRPDLLPLLRVWKPSREEFLLHFPLVVLETGEAPPEICQPADGRGWGRGLGQIDFAAHTAWCLEKLPDGRFRWEDPAENIDKAAELLHAGIVAFEGDEWLAACAYNAGRGNVRKAILALPPSSTVEHRHSAADWITTNHDYARDVITRRERFQRQLTSNTTS